jgi:hypothetical protein
MGQRSRNPKDFARAARYWDLVRRAEPHNAEIEDLIRTILVEQTIAQGEYANQHTNDEAAQPDSAAPQVNEGT